MYELIVGIDLGTTNSVLAVVQNGQVRVIDIHGQSTMPSCVGLDPTGRLIVGQAARNQLIASPDSTVLSIKRRMGEDIKIPLGDKSFSPEEISSFILRELKTEAERQLGVPIRQAVITVPAFFNERQRKATQTAGILAGLEVMRVLNEPTAAALAYGAGRTADETLLVYDLGGGTFDVSVVVAEHGVVEVKASHGDTHLGGDDFDDLLVSHAVDKFRAAHGVDLRGNSQALRRLKVVLEKAKWHLSDEPYVVVREEYLDGTHHLELEIQRHEYEAMIVSLVEKTLACVHRALADAGLQPASLHKVMLVGGSTRTPLVQQLLENGIKIQPRWEINPDLIVAMGAAIQGAIIAGDKPHAILVDITPHTFSTSSLTTDWQGVRHLIATPIIRRNTPLPASKSELFYTVEDQQVEIHVDAMQGESTHPAENVKIGQFEVTGLARVPAGNEVAIHFELDLNAILKVTATEKKTGLAKSVAMDTRGRPALDIDQARQNIAALVGSSALTAEAGESVETVEPGKGIPVDLLVTAKDLRKRGEALLAKGIGAEDAGEIRELIQVSAEAIRCQDAKTLGSTNDTLSDLVFYLED